MDSRRWPLFSWGMKRFALALAAAAFLAGCGTFPANQTLRAEGSADSFIADTVLGTVEVENFQGSIFIGQQDQETQ